MSDAALAVIVGALAGLGSGALAGFIASRQFRAERFKEREQRFETAQIGYRHCYRKFLVNVAACHGGGRGIPLEGQARVGVTTLVDNFWEASFTGDPTVIRELEAYWPAAARANGEPPEPSPPDALLEAMRLHGIRSLKDHQQAQKGFLHPSPPEAAETGG
jgi:type II secretory pathway pseudopilin PulG